MSAEGAKVARVIPANSVLCTCIASIGKNTFSPVKCAFNQQINALTPNNNQDPYFMYIDSYHWSETMKKGAGGLTFQIVNKTEFSNILTNVPCKEEQVKIGKLFKNLDHLITLHQRKLIFLKLHRFLMSVLFCYSWEQRKLGDIATIVGGGTPSTANESYWNGNINWFSPAELVEQNYVYESQNKITKDGLEHSSAKLLPIGTVLFTSRAGIGKTAILAEKACTNQGFQSIVPIKECLDSYFIYSCTNQLKKYGETKGAGSTFVEVSGKQMSEMLIKIPNQFDEQLIVGSFFKKLDSLITLHQRKQL